MPFDVIVVGSGPAGCAAAFDLSVAGHSVLLLDRRAFPRPKPCGGGLTIKTLRRMRYSPAPAIRAVCTDLVVGLRHERADVLTSRHASCVMTRREEFDAFNLRRAVERGAEFRVVSRIIGIHTRGTDVVVDFGTDQIAATYLIGADGVNSTVRRLAGGFPPLAKGFALEAEVACATPPSMRFDFGLVDRGYGWCFPKGDHVNVGLFSGSSDVPISREDLAAYAHARLGPCALERVVGHHIGMRGWESPPCSSRVLLIGDAAGLVDPLLGEGIHNAILSGQAAAESVDLALRTGADAAAEYRAAITPVLEDLHRSQRYADFFYGDVDAGYRLIRAPFARQLLMKGFACGLTITRMRRRWYALPVLRPPAIPDLVGC